MKRALDKSQFRNTYKHLASIPQNFPSNKKQGKLEKLSLEESKAMWQWNVMWYPDWDSGTEKGLLAKTEES